MASSQIEIGSSSTPFGCVLKLKDHNHQERHREPNFQGKFQVLVRDHHFDSCISISTRGSNIETNENSNLKGTNLGCWDENSSKHQDYSNNGPTYEKQSRVYDKGYSVSNSKKTITTTIDTQIHNNNNNNNNNNNCDKADTQLHNNNNNNNDRASRSNRPTDTQTHEPEFMGLSKCHSISSRTSSSMRDPSPTPSDASSNTDISVSSLVQIWRGLEAEAKHNHCNKNNVNNSCIDSNIIIEMNSTNPNTSMQESSFTRDHDQHQQDHVVSSLKDQEKEGLRVVNMVRTWAKNNEVTCDPNYQEKEPPFRVCLARLKNIMNIKEQNQVSSPIFCSPKLRGRQAIADLFMRMERERYKEVHLLESRRVVTKFPQRGRIQSLLKLKILRREASIEEEHEQQRQKSLQWRQQQASQLRPYESNKLQNSANIDNLRERSNTVTSQDTISLKDIQNDITNDIIEEKYANNCNQISMQNKMNSKQDQVLTLSYNEESEEQRNIEHVKNCAPFDIYTPKEDQLLDYSSIEDGENLQEKITYLDQAQRNEIVPLPCTSWEEEQEENETSNDYQLENDQQYFGNNLDWINDIARPKTYWEDRRQAWYEDIFNTHSKDEEIRQLIERGNVSSMLASDFRKKMDELVTCSIQRVTHSTIYEEEENCKSLRALFLKNQRSSFVHDHTEKENKFVDDKKSSSGQQQQGDCEQNVSSLLSWDFGNEDESTDNNYELGATTPLQQPSLDPSTISPIDVEILYDLRAHMHQEMFELRKHVRSCMDAQLTMQDSIKEQVLTTLSQIDQEKHDQRCLKNDFCSICHKNKIDSVLYRCGHMCTCVNCANKLQWSSGVCPICQSQIVDVVQTKH
ncbi:unnamed protein product [Amaranthus hypochondriacus]